MKTFLPLDAPERQPLQWFSFFIALYSKKTMRLTTEGHGAYLMLMLDYYGNGKPCPDDDFILAAVAKLPVEVWKDRYRKVLEPFFVVQDGYWYHEKIEEQILQGHHKHSLAVTKAQKASEAARAARTSPRSPSRTPSRTPSGIDEAKTTSKDTLKESSGVTHEDTSKALHLHIHSTERTVEAAAAGSKEALQEEKEFHLPRDWRPSQDRLDRCTRDGAEDDDVEEEIVKFREWYAALMKTEDAWDSAWIKWWANWRVHRKKLAEAAKPPPIVEVNSNTFIPTAKDFEAGASLFAKDQSKWSRHLGPEPGHTGCRCPHEILSRHGIDPVTGMRIRAETGIKQVAG